VPPGPADRREPGRGIFEVLREALDLPRRPFFEEMLVEIVSAPTRCCLDPRARAELVGRGLEEAARLPDARTAAFSLSEKRALRGPGTGGGGSRRWDGFFDVDGLPTMYASILAHFPASVVSHTGGETTDEFVYGEGDQSSSLAFRSLSQRYFLIDRFLRMYEPTGRAHDASNSNFKFQISISDYPILPLRNCLHNLAVQVIFT
jgi:hypothetical protein